MQVKVEVGDQPLPVRMRVGAIRSQGVSALPIARMTSVVRMMAMVTLFLPLVRTRRGVPKPVRSANVED